MAFADVAGWSHLVEADELGALHAWNALRDGLIEPKIREHGGRLVDTAGDAVFVEFPSAIDALNWALEVQRGQIDAALPAGAARVQLRIGINVCDLLVDQDRLVGDGVNIASRIHQLAAPGEIVVTSVVREQVQGRVQVAFRDLGERRLKNISRPIHVLRVDAPSLHAAGAAALEAAMRTPHTLLALYLPVGQAPADHAQRAPRALHDYLVQELLPASGGRMVWHAGNRWVLEFPRTRYAVKAAFAIQQACAGASAGLPGQRSWLPRIGLQAQEAHGLEGAGAAGPRDAEQAGAGLAAQLIAFAEPGQVVAAAAVRDELTPSLDAEIEDLGDCQLPALGRTERAYRLGPPGTHQITEPEGEADELRPTIAIIPLSERGDGHEPLGEILAEEVIAALSRSAELNVVSRLSTTAFRGRAASLAEVSAHLRADYVLSGTYRVSGGVLVLAAELAEAKAGRVVWAKDLKGSVAGIVEGRDELIDHLVAQASLAVMARELERTRSQSLHSLQTCTLLIGAIALMHRLSPQDFERARQMLAVVAQRTPHHAVPHAWLAKWHVLRVWQGWSDDVAADTRLALDCSQRALDNDSHCSLALAIDGFVHTNLLKQLDVAQERYELALRVNPNDSLAWLLSGMLHAFKGEGRQAVKGTRRALRLSPLDLHRYFYDSLAGGAELAAGHYERAIELTQRSLRANRMHASTFRMLAISQWQLGRHEDARATVAALMKVEPSLRVGEWFRRSPSSEYPIGSLCAEALRQAGVPP